MKTLLYYIFIFLFISSSCSKEETRQAVIAGIYDTSFIYGELSPPLKVELTLDTLTDNYQGNDSIDINQDGVYDLFISQRIHFPPPSGTPTWEQFPYYRLTSRNGLEVATKTESYPVGMGQYNSVNWVDALNYENRIDNISEWSGSNVVRTMWAIPPISTYGFALTNGPWYNLTNVIKYIGIRMKIGSRYKYGWIKMNEISRENMLFLSYALEK
jgi:hypothetical protein